MLRRSRQRGGREQRPQTCRQNKKVFSRTLPTALCFAHTLTPSCPPWNDTLRRAEIGPWRTEVWHIDGPERGDEMRTERRNLQETLEGSFWIHRIITSGGEEETLVLSDIQTNWVKCWAAELCAVFTALNQIIRSTVWYHIRMQMQFNFSKNVTFRLWTRLSPN